jgi:AraC-like DNA-binding protein
MPELKTVSIADLEAHNTTPQWSDGVRSVASPFAAQARAAKPLSAWRSALTLEGMQFSELFYEPQLLQYPQTTAIAERATLFFVHVQLEGESVSRQSGRAAHLHAGDFTLCDGNQSYDIEFVRASRLLVLGIPQAILRRHLSCPEDVVAVGMSGSSGLSGLLSSFLRDLWRQCRISLEALGDSRVTHALLELLASAYAGVPRLPADRGSMADAHRARILEYIEAHLGDSDLTPMKVARACGITPRYLHHLFSGQVDTVARYILRRRLEDCSLALSDPAQRGRTFTAIAFERGFNSTTHFGRAFRARFGMTPREYRRRNLRG